MVLFFSLSRRINKLVGPPILRYGLTARHVLGPSYRENPFLDAFLLIPFAQKMVSLEVQEDANDKFQRAVRQQMSAVEQFVNKTFDRLFGKGPDEEYRTVEELEKINPRLQAFQTYFRPIMVPNEKWSDVMRWQFNVRFVNFVRVEYLKAKYGLDLREALEAYPNLKLGPQASATRMKRKWGVLIPETPDKGKSWLGVLPTTNTVKRAFLLQSWKRRKDMDGVWKRMTSLTNKLGGQVIDVPGSWLKIAKIPPETDVSSLSIEQILEVAGVAGVSSSGSFNLFCEECNIYQLWTREYIDGLADYLLERTQRHDGGDTIVLDVGAGDGFLAQLLRESFVSNKRQKNRHESNTHKRIGKIPEVVAVDDGSWNIIPGADVANLDLMEAFKKYATADDSRQVIVLCSWMPMGVDWTALFRDFNVDEYILIGEHDDGNCGDNWLTWGNIESRLDDPESSNTEISSSSVVPVYEAEGYKRVERSELAKFHFSRFDSSVSCCSKTFSFRRKPR